jgi:hypothetical protein
VIDHLLVSTIRNDKTGAIIQDGFKWSAYCHANDILMADVSSEIENQLVRVNLYRKGEWS